jgi:hypothetical protein
LAASASITAPVTVQCEPFSPTIAGVATVANAFSLTDLKISKPRPDSAIAEINAEEPFVFEINGLKYISSAPIRLDSLYYKPAYSFEVSLETYNRLGIAAFNDKSYNISVTDQYGYQFSLFVKMINGTLVPTNITFETGRTVDSDYRTSTHRKTCSIAP